MDERDEELDAITDAGAFGREPSADYLASLDMLDNAARECIFVSRAHGGIASPTNAHFYASVLFTLMVSKCISLLMLAPHTPWASKRIEHWDYSSMTGIARTLIELRIAFYYLCVEPCGTDEWQVRWNLFNLHDCVSRIRLHQAIGDAEQVADLELQAGELRERLTSNPFFQALDVKRHKKLLHGQTAYLFPLEAIAERAGIDLALFRYLYVLLSSHVHALPMSFYRIGGEHPERGCGLPSAVEENYSALCMSLAATLLTASRDEFAALFATHRPATLVNAHDLDPATANAPEPPPLAVDEVKIVDVSEEIALRWRRMAEDSLETLYLDRASGEQVLERIDHEDGSVELVWADPVYWTFTLNGGTMTQAELDRVIQGPHAFRVDHLKRRILFKAEAGDLTVPDDGAIC